MRTAGRSRRSQRESSGDVPDRRNMPTASKSSKSHTQTQTRAKSVNAVFKPERRLAQPFKRPARLGSSQGNSSPASRSSKTPRTGSPWSSAESMPQTPPQPLGTQPRPLSLLETLPVEILEQVFLHSLNPNFALASPVLATTISSERIYRSLILLAFWAPFPATDEPQSRPDFIARILGPVQHISISRGERARLQESIFHCKWLTVERMRAQLADLRTLAVYSYWVCSHGPMKNADEAPELQSEDRKNRPPLSLFKFPSHFLRGGKQGFSPDDITFLEILRMGSGSSCFPRFANGRIHYFPTVDRDTVQVGIRKALHQRNLDALTTLLKIDEYAARIKQPFATRLVFYVIPSEHFITAVRVSPTDPSFFLALFRASAESLPADDEAVTQWALDLIAAAKEQDADSDVHRNAAFARWLFDWMLHLPEHIQVTRSQPYRTQLFVRGCLSRVPMALRLIDEQICPPEWECVDWLQETSVPFLSTENLCSVEVD